MVNWIVEGINIVCLAFTIAGSFLVNRRGIELRIWMVYFVAANLGIIYFILMVNYYQLGIWIVFLVNDIDAIKLRRNKNTLIESLKKIINELEK